MYIAGCSIEMIIAKTSATKNVFAVSHDRLLNLMSIWFLLKQSPSLFCLLDY